MGTRNQRITVLFARFKRFWHLNSFTNTTRKLPHLSLLICTGWHEHDYIESTADYDLSGHAQLVPSSVSFNSQTCSPLFRRQTCIAYDKYYQSRNLTIRNCSSLLCIRTTLKCIAEVQSALKHAAHFLSTPVHTCPSLFWAFARQLREWVSSENYKASWIRALLGVVFKAAPGVVWHV